MRPRRSRRGLACLVGLLLVAALGPQSAWALQQYVALGDSYSAGVGTRDESLDRRCERSPLAYPALVAGERPGTSLSFVACSGARPQQVLDEQAVWLTPQTTLVTISVGGNDADFARVLLLCSAPGSCSRTIAPAENFVRAELADRLDRVYTEIRRRALAARVLVVGYPHLFGGKRTCNALSSVSVTEQRGLNRVADLLGAITRARATAAGFEFVDPTAAFTRHAVCDREEWLNGLARPVAASYHPNPRGYRAYADLVHAAIGAVPLARVDVAINCVDAEHLPREISLTCADGARRLVGLRWSLWSTGRATGRGKAVVNDCWPSCADGTARRYPVRVELSAPRDCARNAPRQFSRLEYRYTKARPFSRWSRRYEPRSQSRKIGC